MLKATARSVLSTTRFHLDVFTNQHYQRVIRNTAWTAASPVVPQGGFVASRSETFAPYRRLGTAVQASRMSTDQERVKLERLTCYLVTIYTYSCSISNSICVTWPGNKVCQMRCDISRHRIGTPISLQHSTMCYLYV